MANIRAVKGSKIKHVCTGDSGSYTICGTYMAYEPVISKNDPGYRWCKKCEKILKSYVSIYNSGDDLHYEISLLKEINNLLDIEITTLRQTNIDLQNIIEDLMKT